MKTRLLCFLLTLIATASHAQRPTTTNPPLTYDTSGNILPVTMPDGAPPNLAAGTTVGGSIIASGGIAVTDGDKGSLTISGSGTSWIIDPNAVSLTQLADMATASFLGRNTAGTGDPEVLSISTVKTMLALVIGDVSGLQAALDAKLAAVTVDNTVFVDKAGSDATGLRERLDKPFLTIRAADAAALSGDTIHVRSGTYNQVQLGKAGVSYYFDQGDTK